MSYYLYITHEKVKILLNIQRSTTPTLPTMEVVSAIYPVHLFHFLSGSFRNRMIIMKWKNILQFRNRL